MPPKQPERPTFLLADQGALDAVAMALRIAHCIACGCQSCRAWLPMGLGATARYYSKLDPEMRGQLQNWAIQYLLDRGIGKVVPGEVFEISRQHPPPSEN